MISRRRLLQVFAAAPFMPWTEILAEASKPKIFYSIPPAVSALSLSEAAVCAIELETFMKDIPDLISSPVPFYSLFRERGALSVGMSRPDFRIPMRLANASRI